MDEAERLKDFKVSAGIDNHLGAARFQLLKGNRLACLVSKTCARLGVGEEMIQTVTQDQRQQIEDNLLKSDGVKHTKTRRPLSTHSEQAAFR